jgi:hypothetical protein
MVNEGLGRGPQAFKAFSLEEAPTFDRGSSMKGINDEKV